MNIWSSLFMPLAFIIMIQIGWDGHLWGWEKWGMRISGVGKLGLARLDDLPALVFMQIQVDSFSLDLAIHLHFQHLLFLQSFHQLHDAISLHIKYQFQRMRSQYYLESTVSTYPRKPPTPFQHLKNRAKDPSLGQSKTRSRHHRDMTSSISIRQSKHQETSSNNLRQEIAAQWIQVKCMDCQALRSQHGKTVKELQMLWEEELTEEKEKYISMERKYLLKESEMIQMQAEYAHLQELYSELEERLDFYRAENQAQAYKLTQIEEQVQKVTLQNKNNLEKIDTLHKFLKLYLEQTRLLISWAHLLEQLKDDLPATVHAVREEMIDRRPDCEATLREITTLERLAFSNIAIKDQPSAFFEDNEDSESFMKYLKQEQPRPSTKKGNSFLDSNKQNVDYQNSMPTMSLFPQTRPKNKPPLSDQFLRVLFLQAKALEGSQPGWLSPCQLTRADQSKALIED